MNFAGADKIITEYLAANWTTTPISWPNLEGRNYSALGAPLLPAGTEDYVALRTNGAGSRTVTVDGSCIRYNSRLFVAIAVKEGTGVRVARGYTDSLVLLLENVRLTGGDGDIRMGNIIGPIEYRLNNGWAITEFNVSYEFERFTG